MTTIEASDQEERRYRPKAEEKNHFPDSKCWQKFLDGCPNKATQKCYVDDVLTYMADRKITKPEQLLGHDEIANETTVFVANKAEAIEDDLVTFINNQKAQKVSGELVSRRISAIKKFYKRNRMSKLIDWDFVREGIGDIPRKTGTNSGGDAYSMEDLAKMYAIADEREKAVLTLTFSSGVRKGAHPQLSIGDLMPIETMQHKYRIFQITVYRGFKNDEYPTWCTPECRKDVENYFAFRQRYGEVLTPDAPVVRDKFDTDDPLGAKVHPHRLGERAFYNILSQLAERAGIRKRVHLTEGQEAGKVRHKVKAVHGLRKSFDTQCTNAGVTPIWVEFFEGRQLQGSKGRYYRPADSQLLEGIHETNMRGYVHAIPMLTINNEERLSMTVDKLQEKLKDAPALEVLQNEVLSKSMELSRMKKSVEEDRATMSRLEQQNEENARQISAFVEAANGNPDLFLEMMRKAKEAKDQKTPPVNQ